VLGVQLAQLFDPLLCNLPLLLGQGEPEIPLVATFINPSFVL
jgi:hypothetical protein